MKSFFTKTQKKKIFVGLSGGVDSAVAALLLKEAGHAVTGVFIRTWHPEGFPCSEGEDEREAMRVAAHLEIPFRTLDLSARYKQEVADLMLAGYARGETPNPDVLCNREVKFGGFLEYAKKEGADLVATGHYARLTHHDSQVQLRTAVDSEKDQSYFLSLVPHEALASAVFPLGNMHKAEVREYAKKAGLPNAARKDSQGICFLGAVDMKQFLSEFISVQKGAVLNTEGVVIGEHDGSVLYTLGERHGFRVMNPGTDSKPLYVLSIDHAANTLTVGEKTECIGSTTLRAQNPVLHAELVGGNIEAQVRYHGERYPGTVRLADDTLYVTLTTPAVVARGQTIALYTGEVLVAAGIAA